MECRLVDSLLHPSDIYDVAFSPDGQTLATTSDEARLWRIGQSDRAVVLDGHERSAVAVAFFESGTKLASSDYSSIRLWNLVSNKPIAAWKAHTSWVYRLAIAASRNAVISVGNDNYIRKWSIETFEELASRRFSNLTRNIAISPDDEIIAMGCRSTIRILTIDRLQDVFTLRRHRGEVRTVAFSPDGELLASGSSDGAIKVWSVVSQREVMAMKGHRRLGTARVAFSPDGRWLASTGGDGAVVVWDIGNGSAIAQLELPDRIISCPGETDGVRTELLLNSNMGNCVAFSHDSKMLAAGGQSLRLQVWSIG